MAALAKAPESRACESELFAVESDDLNRSPAQEQIKVGGGVFSSAPLQYHRGFEY